MTNENEQLKRLLKHFLKQYCELYWHSLLGQDMNFFDEEYFPDPIDHALLTQEDEEIIFSIIKELAIKDNKFKSFIRSKTMKNQIVK